MKIKKSILKQLSNSLDRVKRDNRNKNTATIATTHPRVKTRFINGGLYINPRIKSGNNIKASIKARNKHIQYVLSNIHNFAKACHMGINRNTQNIFMQEIVQSKEQRLKSLPKSITTPRSYSTASELVPNQKIKTALVDIMWADHFYYNDFKENFIKGVASCGNHLHFAMGHDLKGNRHHFILNRATAFCDFKYCPLRQRGKARKRAKKIYEIIMAMYHDNNWMPIFITLTLPDIKPGKTKVRKIIHQLNNSTDKLLHSPRYNGFNAYNKNNKGILKGYIRKIESAYNNRIKSKAYGKLNYHTHVIGFVRKSYLTKQGSKYYVPQDQWVKDWEHINHWDYKKHHGKHLVVSVEAPYIKKNGKKIKITHIHNKHLRAMAFDHMAKELGKYPVKGANFKGVIAFHKKTNRQKLDRLVSQDLIKQGKPSAIVSSNTLKKERRKFINRAMTRSQKQTLKAFHAVIHGEKNQKLLGYKGFAQVYKHKDLSKYDPNKNKVIIFTSAIDSRYQYSYKDYLDQESDLTFDDVEHLAIADCMISSTLLKNPTYQKAYNKGVLIKMKSQSKKAA